jgi:hypothetical protein
VAEERRAALVVVTADDARATVTAGHPVELITGSVAAGRGSPET